MFLYLKLTSLFLVHSVHTTRTFSLISTQCKHDALSRIPHCIVHVQGRKASKPFLLRAVVPADVLNKTVMTLFTLVILLGECQSMVLYR